MIRRRQGKEPFMSHHNHNHLSTTTPSYTLLPSFLSTFIIHRSKKKIIFTVLFLILLWLTTAVGFATYNVLRSAYHNAAAYQDNAAYHNSAAICAVQKGALQYLDEWVYYHLLAIGFDHIYLYDNSDDFELKEWHANLANLQGVQEDTRSVEQRITIKHFPGVFKQYDAYSECAKHIQQTKAHEWIAFIDVDEFVVLRNQRTQYHTIMDLLNTLSPKRFAGLAVNWVVFSMNHQKSYEPFPVTMRFPNRTAEATNHHIKTIARSKHIDYVDHPHYANLITFYRKDPCRNPTFNFLFIHRFARRVWKWWHEPNSALNRDSHGNWIYCALNPRLVVDDIALYHYRPKSLEEYKSKCSRGRADVPLEDWGKELACQSDEEIMAEWWHVNETIVDDAPWKLLQERVPSYTNQFLSKTSR